MSLLVKQCCFKCCHLTGVQGEAPITLEALPMPLLQLTVMYYIAGSPQVYDSSNPRDTPGRVNYVGPPNDQKLCSTW
jgi:hypothetical protein